MVFIEHIFLKKDKNLENYYPKWKKKVSKMEVIWYNIEESGVKGADFR